MANPVVHFEIFVNDLERAKKFYSEVLGWAFAYIKEMNYTLVYPNGEVTQGPAKLGINGGMALRQSLSPQNKKGPSNAFVCTVAVDDIDAVLAKVEPNGGSIDMPVDTVPGVGWLAYIRDTEFNMIGLLQTDMK
jgi:uncharacterized protein